MKFEPSWTKFLLTFLFGIILFVVGGQTLSNCSDVGCAYQLGPVLFALVPAVAFYGAWSIME